MTAWIVHNKDAAELQPADTPKPDSTRPLVNVHNVALSPTNWA